ncbi:MAG: phenylacetate-CoA ligase [Candidatus Atribacteria bacterium]|nr:phenylacetate-CoA ligase [Candidatus Atribacteria bacterium]
MEITIWDEYYELLPRKELEKIQLNRLKRTLIRAYHNLPYYRHKLEAEGIDIHRFKTMQDLKHLPFTCKEDLRRAYPFGAIAEPLRNIVRIHSSSGSTGSATVVGYTAGDIEIWAELMARTLTGSGASEEDIVQVAFGYGLFTGGLGAHYGAERIGATVVPMSTGNTARQVQILQDFNISVLCCTPSYALYLAEVAQEQKVDWSKTRFRIGIFGAEPWSEEMRADLEQKLPIQAFDIYGLSEIIGPGVGFECQARAGLHVSEDHFIPEIINPDTGEVLPPGETGELVITTITKEGTPVIRYRTGDVSSLIPEPCACGRTLTRIKRIKARTDDMLIIRGVNVYPSQIESALLSFKELEPHYQIVITKENFMDRVDIKVEVAPEFFSDEVKTLEKLKQSIEEKLRAELNIHCHLRLMEPKSIERTSGKSNRVVDLRKKEGLT